MDSTDMLPKSRPTPTRPLLGMTVLAVEDSRFACEALRLMCLRSGARIRRADSLSAARRHLKVYRPSIAIVDIGLPDGSGAELISDLSRGSPRVGTLLATSGDPFGEEMAIAAGADGFLAKPYTSLAAFQATVVGHLPPAQRAMGPHVVVDEVIRPDVVAYRDDIAHAADLLEDRDDPLTLDYLTQFLSGIATAAGDDALLSVVSALSAARQGGASCEGPVARLSAIVQSRLSSDRSIAI